MKIHRQATEAEAGAILGDMAIRGKAGEEVRASLAKHFTPEKLAATLASLPAESQRQFIEPPVRHAVNFTHRKKP